MATKKSSATGSTKSTTRKATTRKTASTSRAKSTKATSTRKTAAKPAAATATRAKTVAAKPAAKPATAAKSAKVQGVTLTPTTAAKTLGKKDLFERIKTRSGVKGRDARKVMDAVLDELGSALVRGETLKLPPLGTVKVQRQKAADAADMVICKLRRKKPADGPKDPLAEAAE